MKEDKTATYQHSHQFGSVFKRFYECVGYNVESARRKLLKNSQEFVVVET